ncbi:hypothetical protein Q604_UNBC15331G0001, partial [human gut metagenome]
GASCGGEVLVAEHVDSPGGAAEPVADADCGDEVGTGVEGGFGDRAGGAGRVGVFDADAGAVGGEVDGMQRSHTNTYLQ